MEVPAKAEAAPAAPASTAPVEATAPPAAARSSPLLNVGVWGTDEHERYLQAKFANPKASWKEIARLVGTRSARQVILHDQKFRAKMERRRSKFERAMTPRPGAGTASVPAAATVASQATSAGGQDDMRYFDSMGVLLLASVASSRVPKIQESGELQTTQAPSVEERSEDR